MSDFGLIDEKQVTLSVLDDGALPLRATASLRAASSLSRSSLRAASSAVRSAPSAVSFAISAFAASGWANRLAISLT